MTFADEPIAKLREVVEILRRRPRRVAVESRQPMPHVRGIADLAHLAVAHDVEPGVLLQPNDLVHALLQCVLEMLRIDVVAAILSEQQIDDCLRSWKAADVSGEDAVGTCHRDAMLNAQCPMLNASQRTLTRWPLSIEHSALFRFYQANSAFRRTTRGLMYEVGACHPAALGTNVGLNASVTLLFVRL